MYFLGGSRNSGEAKLYLEVIIYCLVPPPTHAPVCSQPAILQFMYLQATCLLISQPTFPHIHLCLCPSAYPAIHSTCVSTHTPVSSPIHPCVHPLVHLSVHPSIRVSTFLHPSVYSPIYLSIHHPLIYISTCLFIHPSMHPSVHLSTHPPAHPPPYQSTQPSTRPSIHPSIHFTHPSAHLFIRPCPSPPTHPSPTRLSVPSSPPPTHPCQTPGLQCRARQAGLEASSEQMRPTLQDFPLLGPSRAFLFVLCGPEHTHGGVPRRRSGRGPPGITDLCLRPPEQRREGGVSNRAVRVSFWAPRFPARDAACPALPAGTSVWSRGCGAGSRLTCQKAP